MNAIIPRSGDAVEWVTTKTGLKNWWEGYLAKKDYTPPTTCAVVIPCHNYGRFLGDAIESVLAQTMPATEIVVILDHCTDHSREVAEKYPVRVLETNACDVHLVRRLGTRETTSDVVIFLDADDRIGENYIKTGMKAFSDPHAGIVTGDAQFFGADDFRWTPEITDMQQACCATSASLVRREAIEHSGCFEDLSLTGVPSEDWETWKLIDRAGWQTRKAKITHYHRRHTSNSTLSDQYPDSEYQRRQRSKAGYQPRKIKLAFVGPSLALGGVETMAVAQIKYARNLEWIGAWVPNHAARSPSISANLPKICTGQEGLDKLAQECDVIYAWGGPTETIKNLRKYHKPIVYGVHGMGEWSRNQVHAIADAVDALWCVSSAALDCVPEEHRNKARLILGGADLRVAICDRDRADIRRDWGIGDEELAVGYVGRLSGEKNPAVIAEAVKLIPNAKLVCCSPHADLHTNPIRKQIHSTLGSRVIWTNSGKQPMGEVYRGLDCLVVASHEEGMPTVTLEAWAAGLPVVSTPVGLILELEPEHGSLVERIPLKPNPAQIVAAIAKAVQPNPERLTRTRELMLNQMSVQRMALEVEELVADVRDNFTLPRPFVIRSLPRCGTHMLKSALDSHPEICCRGEILNPNKTQHDLAGWTVERIYQEYTGPAAGFVAHAFPPGCPQQYPAAPEIWPIVQREKPVLIVLSRRDLLRRCASLALANKTNVWSIPQPQQVNTPAKPITLAPGQVREWIDRATEADSEARRLFPWAIFVDYEDLVADWETKIAEIQRAIGVREVLPLKPATQKQGSDRPIREVIANYDELRAEFKNRREDDQSE